MPPVNATAGNGAALAGLAAPVPAGGVALSALPAFAQQGGLVTRPSAHDVRTTLDRFAAAVRDALMSDTEAVRRHLYGWAAPNTHRVSILLEELGLDDDVTAVNIRARERFAPEILALNPFGKVLILVEPRPGEAPLVLFESGAILLHPAEVPYLAGEDDSIADIAAFPWIARPGWAARRLEDTPNIARWHDRIAAHSAVQRGIAVPQGAVLS